MSAELRDFRCKLTVEADVVLDAEARAFGRDKTDIVRQILHEWALKKIMAANVLHRNLRSEGLSGASGGAAGGDGGIEGANRVES